MPMHVQEIMEKTKYLDEKVTELFEDDYLASIRSLGFLLRNLYIRSLDRFDKTKDLENYLNNNDTCHRLFMDEIDGCWLLLKKTTYFLSPRDISIDLKPITIESVVEDKKSKD